MNRKEAAKCATQTLEILEAQGYTNAAGEHVDLSAELEAAIQGTCAYPPEDDLPGFESRGLSTHIEVDNETTLQAARRLAEAGHRVCALNFASAKNPGGGFQNGSRAQEESLARSSGLFACIDGHPMYRLHRAQKDALYTSYAIYSPGVPVFRSDDGELLEAPYLCSFLTAPAVNAGVVLQRKPSRKVEVAAEMEARIAKVLSIAAHYQYDALVLGAWGCGVFKNDPRQIARLFAQVLLHETFDGCFAHVAFAVLDNSRDERFIKPFRDAF